MTFSADGTKIVYAGTYDGLPPGIIQVNLDGTEETSILPWDQNYQAVEPAVSPDGLKIAFVNERNAQIYVMDADGSNIQQLTFDQNTSFAGQCGGGICDISFINQRPDWYPLDDHAQLIYLHWKNTCGQLLEPCVRDLSIRRIDSNGTNIVTLIQETDLDGDAA